MLQLPDASGGSSDRRNSRYYEKRIHCLRSSKEYMPSDWLSQTPNYLQLCEGKTGELKTSLGRLAGRYRTPRGVVYLSFVLNKSV